MRCGRQSATTRRIAQDMAQRRFRRGGVRRVRLVTDAGEPCNDSRNAVHAVHSSYQAVVAGAGASRGAAPPGGGATTVARSYLGDGPAAPRRFQICSGYRVPHGNGLRSGLDSIPPGCVAHLSLHLPVWRAPRALPGGRLDAHSDSLLSPPGSFRCRNTLSRRGPSMISSSTRKPTDCRLPFAEADPFHSIAVVQSAKWRNTQGGPHTQPQSPRPAVHRIDHGLRTPRPGAASSTSQIQLV